MVMVMTMVIDSPTTKMDVTVLCEADRLGFLYKGPLFLEEESHAPSHWARRDGKPVGSARG